ncbi:hypothetical protein EIN_047450 [Entamoeba invadens IP1]|uniref:Uncharacterized protein n=1 Tax=Entamoeba invadens IP1 TaxID=370355 RepID=A0A0A1UG61_ENTIV|nr:hypothetical protein EIN_047450 [Entamoeba invadens IP1]ELP94452.1 hypothetical protein EIN_047450 [Entamoeba invadens IP1]|eukprot:XP_004261223.1 hypothetical protein EIN_047450 [Entamoeba invadens IP1]
MTALDRQQVVNNFLLQSQKAHNAEENKQMVAIKAQIMTFPNYYQNLIQALDIPQLQISALIFLRQFVTETSNIQVDLVNAALRLSLQANVNSHMAQGLVTECFKKGNFQVKNYIVRTIHQTLTTSPNVQVLETAASVIEEDVPSEDGKNNLCGVFFPVILALFHNNNLSVPVVQAILKFLKSALSINPDYFSDCGGDLVVLLVRYAWSTDDVIRELYASILASFLSTEPDHLTCQLSTIFQSCLVLLSVQTDNVCSAAASLLSSLSHAFKEQLQPLLPPFIESLLKRIDEIITSTDSPFVGEDPLLRNLTSTMDDLAGEFHDDFVVSVVTAAQHITWPSAVFVISSLAKSWREKDKFREVFGWMVEKIFIELHNGTRSVTSLWGLQEMYIFLPSILAPKDYQDLLLSLLSGNVQPNAILLLETMIDDKTNTAVQCNSEKIMNWVIQSLLDVKSNETALLLVETISALSDRVPEMFLSNKNLFVVVIHAMIGVIKNNEGLGERVVQNMSYIIPKFGGDALIGYELELVKIVIEMIHSDDTRDQAAALILLNALIETTKQPVGLIRSMSNVVSVILCGIQSVDETVVNQAFTLLGVISQNDPITLSSSLDPLVETLLAKLNEGDLSLRLWAVGMLIKAAPDRLEKVLPVFVDTFVKLVPNATNMRDNISFFKRNLCVCFGRVALVNPNLVAPHITVICDTLIDALLDLGDKEARMVCVKGLGQIIWNNPICCKHALSQVVNVFKAERELSPEDYQFCNTVLLALKNTFSGEAYARVWSGV